jgi:hypothetical protein
MQKDAASVTLLAIVIMTSALVACSTPAKGDEPDTPIQKRMKSCFNGVAKQECAGKAVI